MVESQKHRKNHWEDIGEMVIKFMRETRIICDYCNMKLKSEETNNMEEYDSEDVFDEYCPSDLTISDTEDDSDELTDSDPEWLPDSEDYSDCISEDEHNIKENFSYIEI